MALRRGNALKTTNGKGIGTIKDIKYDQGVIRNRHSKTDVDDKYYERLIVAVEFEGTVKPITKEIRMSANIRGKIDEVKVGGKLVPVYNRASTLMHRLNLVTIEELEDMPEDLEARLSESLEKLKGRQIKCSFERDEKNPGFQNIAIQSIELLEN